MQQQTPPTTKLMLGMIVAGAVLAASIALLVTDVDFLRATFGFTSLYRRLVGINLLLWSLAALAWLSCLAMRAKGYHPAWGLFGATGIGAVAIALYPPAEHDPFQKPHPFKWVGGPHLFSTFVLFALVGAAFWNSLKLNPTANGWVLDNLYIIKSDARHKADTWHDKEDGTGPGVKQIFIQDYWWPKGISGLFRPLSTLTYWLNYTVFGNRTDTTYYHVVNFYLHWSNAALVYALAYTLIRRWPLALAASAIFAVHPITVESVTNIIGRADQLAAFAVLLGLLLWIRADRSDGWRKLAWFIMVMLVTALGVFAKESALALGLVIVAYDLVYRWSPRFTRFFTKIIVSIVLTLFVGFCITGLPRPDGGALRNMVSFLPIIAAAAIAIAAIFVLMTSRNLWQDSPQLWELRWTIASYTVAFVVLLALPYFSGRLFARLELFDKLSIGQRYARAGAVCGLAIVAYLVLLRAPAPIRYVGLILAVIGAIVSSVYIRWFGLVVTFSVGLIELVVQAGAPVRLAESQAWRSLRQRFVTGYFLLLPPALAMYFVRAWVFANSTPPETPFLDNPLRGGPFDPLSFWQARITAIKVIGKLVYLLFWPVHLSSDYSYDQIPLFTFNLLDVENLKALVAVAFVIGCFVAAAHYYQRDKALSFFILFFFAATLPTSNLLMMIGSIMAERFMYLPLIGFAGAIVIIAAKLLSRLFQTPSPADHTRALARRVVYAAVPAIIITLFVARTFVRNLDWFSDVTLWRAAGTISPQSFRCYQSLAYALFEEHATEHVDEMIATAEKALPIVNPLPLDWNSSRLYLHLGMYYLVKGDALTAQKYGREMVLDDVNRPWYQKSVDMLKQASQIDRAFNEVNFRRQLQRGDAPERIYEAGYPPVYTTMGAVYFKLGMHRESINSLRYAIHLEPMADAEPFYRIATNYVQMQKYDEAASSLIECLLNNGQRTEVWVLLAQIYSLLGENAEGTIARAENGELRLNSRHTVVRMHLMDAFRDMIRVLIRAKRRLQAQRMREFAVQTYGFPSSIFDSLFEEEVPLVTPEGLVYPAKGRGADGH